MSSNSDDPSLARLLGKNRWFSELPASVISDIRAQVRHRHLGDGECVYAKGDLPDGLYGVVSGAARISNIGLDGREAVLAILSPGSWFGEISLIDGLPRSHDTHASGPTELLFLSRQNFQQLLDRHPELYPLFMRLLCRRLRVTFAVQEDSALLPLPARLVKRLLMHAHNYGQTEPDGNHLAVQLSQESLGLMLNSSRQSVNKLLKRMEQADWLRVRYGQIVILDEPALNRMAGGELPADW
ncbi:Crp/Fnr family transcriptional regulator [Halopseudomonas salegens]|uniref:Crp/Fnr family transcriptional regulator n=1 Tax=Halopseudomonas salegens TaxID=1434072 RepID=UPI0015603E57|nr:Crp/Fnr family transcriptional regulator [Halopseudomonas salegens]